MAGEFCGVAGTSAASKGWGCVKCSEITAIPGNFAMIVKISLGLRKFRNRGENFVILGN